MSSYLASVFKLFLSWWCLAGAAGTALAVICLFRVCPAPGLRRELRLWPSTLLAGYPFLLLWLLVLGRNGNGSARAALQPFWSYRAVSNGRHYLLYMNLFNLLIFAPVGFLLPAAWPKAGLLRTLGFGALISLLGELLQLFSGKGLFELDDLFHNTIGTLIGVLLWQGAAALLRRREKDER